MQVKCLAWYTVLAIRKHSINITIRIIKYKWHYTFTSQEQYFYFFLLYSMLFLLLLDFTFRFWVRNNRKSLNWVSVRVLVFEGLLLILLRFWLNYPNSTAKFLYCYMREHSKALIHGKNIIYWLIRLWMEVSDFIWRFTPKTTRNRTLS